MVESLPPVEGGTHARIAARTEPVSRPKLSVVGSTPAAEQVPDLPPAEVLAALDTAARVLSDLDRKQVSLHLDHDVSTGEVRVHVKSDATGAEHEILPQRLLNILAGDTTGLVVDIRG
jgi:hypothetical protein